MIYWDEASEYACRMLFEMRLDNARQAARAFNWAGWQIPPDYFLPGITRAFPDQPLVTRPIFFDYLTLCSWVWQRPLAPAEQQYAFDQLTLRWPNFCLQPGYGSLYDFVALVWMFGNLNYPGPVYTKPVYYDPVYADPQTQNMVHEHLARRVPYGVFPDLDVPLVDLAPEPPAPTDWDAAVGTPAPEPLAATPRQSRSTTRQGSAIALDGMYQCTMLGLLQNIYGSGSNTEIYAFFPEGRYFYFQNAQAAGAQLLDPQSRHGGEGTYTIAGGQIILAEDGREAHSSEFSASSDLKQIKFYGKTFTWMGDVNRLRRR